MKSLRRICGIALISIGALGFFGSSAFGQTDQEATNADVPTAYTLSASSVAVGVQIIGSTLPLAPGGEYAFASPASTQAYLDSTSSNAYASAPFPGNFIISLPTTVDGLTSGAFPPVPSYPFYVASTDPTTPTQSQEVGPYGITASSGPNASSGSAQIGLSTSSPLVASITSQSSVSLDPNTGIMTVLASAEIAPFQLNSILSLGDIHSSVTLTYDPSNPTAGVVEKDSFSAGTITILGVQVGLTAQGLTLPGGVGIPLNLSALQGALAKSGLSLQYLPAVRSTDSVTTAGLQLTFNQTLPTSGDTTVKFVLGQVSAALTPGTEIPLSDGSDAVTPLSTGNSGSTALGSSGSGPTSLPSLSLPAAAPLTTTAPGGSTSELPATQTQILGFIPVRLSDVSLLYLALTVGGLLALVGSRTTHWLALKLRLAGRGGSPSG